MKYKVIPFVAKITHEGSTAEVSKQLEQLINEYSDQGWNFVRIESVETQVAPNAGCFGLGAKAGFTTTFKMDRNY